MVRGVLLQPVRQRSQRAAQRVTGAECQDDHAPCVGASGDHGAHHRHTVEQGVCRLERQRGLAKAEQGGQLVRGLAGCKAGEQGGGMASCEHPATLAVAGETSGTEIVRMVSFPCATTLAAVRAGV